MIGVAPYRLAGRSPRWARAGFRLPMSRRRTFASALQAPAHSDLPALRHPWLRSSHTPASGTRGARSLFNESPRRKPRGCPGGETRRVFPSAHASGFQTGRRGVTPTVEPAYLGHFTGNMASCHFPLADLRRPVFTRASGPDAEGVGAGLCPATVSRRRRRDGGDGATASPQRASGEMVRGNPEPAHLQIGTGNASPQPAIDAP